MNNRRTIACIGKNNGTFFCTDTAGGIRCYRRHTYVFCAGLCLILFTKNERTTYRKNSPDVPDEYLYYCPRTR
jgi:hypothetical protein